ERGLADARRAADRLSRRRGAADGREQLFRFRAAPDKEAQRITVGIAAESRLEVGRLPEVVDMPEVGERLRVIGHIRSSINPCLYGEIIRQYAYSIKLE